eukprot:3560-Alexandrium_andersonii.AAC.1
MAFVAREADRAESAGAAVNARSPACDILRRAAKVFGAVVRQRVLRSWAGTGIGYACVGCV